MDEYEIKDNSIKEINKSVEVALRNKDLCLDIGELLGNFIDAKFKPVIKEVKEKINLNELVIASMVELNNKDRVDNQKITQCSFPANLLKLFDDQYSKIYD